MAYRYFPDNGRLFDGDPVIKTDDAKINQSQFGQSDPKGRRQVWYNDEPYEVQFQADPLNTSEMGYAGNYHAPVQLPMLAPAERLRDGVLSGQLRSVDAVPPYPEKLERWAYQKTEEPGDPLYEGLKASGGVVHKPVVMFNPGAKDFVDVDHDIEVMPHSVWLGDGNHRVATAGKYYPQSEVPLSWESEHYMGDEYVDWLLPDYRDRG